MNVRGAIEQGIRRWWDGGGGGMGSALRSLSAPLEWAYGESVEGRNRLFDRTGGTKVADLAVVSVGNLAAGGTGKTPLAAWTARTLASSGARVTLLAGGHGRDEILLHRRWNPDVPAVADRSRVHAARQARARGADVVVLDDGFQHRRLARDLDLVLLAAEDPFPGHLLPRGPYREPPTSLGRAHAVVVTRRTAGEREAAGLAVEVARRFPHLVLGRVALVSAGWQDLAGAGAPPPAGPVLAVAAVARPECFAVQVASATSTEVELMAFSDHWGFDDNDARAMRARAGQRTVVITEKDAVKLRPYASTLGPIRVLAQTPRWEAGEGAVANLITGVRAS